MTDPPAPDLGALRKRVDLAIAWLNGDLTYVPKDWTPSEAGPDVAVLRAAYDAQAARLAAAEQARDDCSTSTYEMLGELLAAHQITPDPCPGGPCVVNALLAIGHALTAAEQRATRLAALEQSVCHWALRDYMDDPMMGGAERGRRVQAMLDAHKALHPTCPVPPAVDSSRAKLAALEAAARAWREVFTDAPAQDPWYGPWRALHEAVANLPAPPEEGA